MKIWVDCTAAAHPLVLRPIIERLEDRGDEVFVTAREYGQTVGILDRLGMHYTVVGEHGGASRWGKARALESRSRALTKVVWDKRPELALAHGSVDLAVVSWLLRIPAVQMQDYEYANLQRKIAFRWARRVLAPEAIPVDRLRKLGAKPKKLVRYPGLKEEYYLYDFVPDEAIIDDLGLDRTKVITVVRPPPETSEYHAPNDLYGATVRRLAEADGEVQAVIIPRTREQGEQARALGAPNLLIPERAIDAQSLIACADLVVSAGDDEPRGRRPRHPRLHDLQRPHGRRRRGADPRRPAAGPERPGGAAVAQADRSDRGPESTRPGLPHGRGAGRRRRLPVT